MSRGKRFRSAITGRFVAMRDALLHPKTTVAETRDQKPEATVPRDGDTGQVDHPPTGV